MGNPKCTFSCLTSLTTNCCVEWSRIEILHPVWESVVCENPCFLEHDAASLCKQFLTFWRYYSLSSGPDSSVSIATGYGLDGPGIESRWGRDFPQLSRSALGAHPASCTMSTRSFPGGKEQLGHDADPSPPSSAVVMKEYSYTSTPLLGMYGLYRASVPVQGCTVPLLYSLSRCQGLLSSWHCIISKSYHMWCCVTSRKTWTCGNTVVRTSIKLACFCVW
jgi:hypothetical protein